MIINEAEKPSYLKENLIRFESQKDKELNYQKTVKVWELMKMIKQNKTKKN